MTNIKRLILLISLFGTMTTLMAQPIQKPKEDEDIVAVSNDYIKNEKVIFVKWFSTDYVPKEGYNVYRKLLAKNVWEKINAQPITIKQTLTPNLNFDTDEQSYWAASKKLKPEDHDKAGMIIGFSYLKSINNFDFSELLGMGYRDNTVEEGKQYRYMVKTIKAGKEVLVDSSMVIQQGPWSPDMPISKITALRKPKQIDFKFTVEHHKYYSLAIERKGVEGGFTARNKAPILIQKDENGNFPDVVFSDKPTHKDTSYTYLVYGVNYFGKRTQPSAEILVAKKDFDPPKPVTDVVYDQDTLDVKLSWQPAAEKEADLKGYDVYRSLHYDKDYEKVTPSLLAVSSTSYVDKLAEPGEYYYMIVAVDQSNNESNAAAIMADIRDVVAPAKPQGIQAIASEGMVKLTWTANAEKDLKGYLIYKSLVGKNTFVAVNGLPTKLNVYEEKMPKQVKNRFVYKVLAVDSTYNRSDYSDSVIVKLPDVVPPAVPVIKSIEVVSKGLKMEWLQSVDNDLTAYMLYRIDQQNKDKTPVLVDGNLPVAAKIYTDISAVKNHHYTYFLCARDSAGNKSALSTGYAYHWVDTKTVLKIKDFDVKLISKDKKAKITWAIEKDEHYKGCIVFRSFNNEEMVQLSGNLKDGLEFMDTKLSFGNYTYLLKLYDQLGNITKSSLVKITYLPEK